MGLHTIPVVEIFAYGVKLIGDRMRLRQQMRLGERRALAIEGPPIPSKFQLDRDYDDFSTPPGGA